MPRDRSTAPLKQTCTPSQLEGLDTFLAPRLRDILSCFPAWDKLEEIRVRARRPLMVSFAGEESFLDPLGRPVAEIGRAYNVTSEDCDLTWQLMSRGSLYTLEEEMRRGFLTLPGGHRVGIAGKVVLNAGEVRMIRDVAGLNIRIARAVPGAAQSILPYLLYRGEGSVYVESTLVVSQPQCGKTTMLRDLARIISRGEPSLQLPGRKVVILDERSEIAACHRGIPQHDVGPRTDVLDGCPKAEGAMMALRGLSPQVMVTDEIGRKADVEALIEAKNGGVSIIASAHGKDWNDVRRRPILQPLWESRVFQRIVILSRRNGPGTVEGIQSL